MKYTIINLFGLEVDKIENLEINNICGHIFAEITLKKVPTKCPICHKLTTCVKDYRKRTINHAVLNDMDTTLVYNMRRMHCPHCNKSFPEENPFVMPGRRISIFTVRRIMELLKEPRTTFSMAAADIGCSVTSVINVFDEHAGIKTSSFPEILCIDEVYSVKYTQNVYACVLADFTSCQIYDLIESRRKHDLVSYFLKVPQNTRDSVKYISMDMWEPYRDIANIFFHNALVCVDSFHVVSNIIRAFDSVRIRIMKSYSSDSDEYYLLKKYSWLLRMKMDDVDMSRSIRLYKNTAYRGKGYINPRNLINIMLDMDDELAQAYLIKEAYYRLNSTSTIDNVEERLDSFLRYLEAADLPEFRRVRKTLLNWKQEIINSFNLYDGRRISNGPIESINSRIGLIRANGNGYASFERFRRRVLYSLSVNSSIKF